MTSGHGSMEAINASRGPEATPRSHDMASEDALTGTQILVVGAVIGASAVYSALKYIEATVVDRIRNIAQVGGSS